MNAGQKDHEMRNPANRETKWTQAVDLFVTKRALYWVHTYHRFHDEVRFLFRDESKRISSLFDFIYLLVAEGSSSLISRLQIDSKVEFLMQSYCQLFAINYPHSKLFSSSSQHNNSKVLGFDLVLLRSREQWRQRLLMSFLALQQTLASRESLLMSARWWSFQRESRWTNDRQDRLSVKWLKSNSILNRSQDNKSLKSLTWKGGKVKKTLLPWYILCWLSQPGGEFSDIIVIFVAAVSWVNIKSFGELVNPEIWLRSIKASSNYVQTAAHCTL